MGISKENSKSGRAPAALSYIAVVVVVEEDVVLRLFARNGADGEEIGVGTNASVVRDDDSKRRRIGWRKLSWDGMLDFARLGVDYGCSGVNKSAESRVMRH